MLEPLTFDVALGHRLRRVREDQKLTADDIARHSTLLGLDWDRSTVARIELGKRRVTAAELFLLPRLYGGSNGLPGLLPTERVTLTSAVAATPDALASVLSRSPAGRKGWSLPKWDELLAQTWDRLKASAPSREAWAREAAPGAESYGVVVEASTHMREEATTKAAARLGATPLQVAVAALQSWDRGLAEERDARVEAMGPATSTRARQARRGHVTRTLLAELAPVVDQVRTGSTQQQEVSDVKC